MITPAFSDGDLSAPLPTSNAARSYPFRKYGDLTHATYSRDYMQALASFAPAPISEQDPLCPGFYLVEESAPESKQGAICTFTRTYSNVPLPHYGFAHGSFERPSVPGSGQYRIYGSEATGDAGLFHQPDPLQDSFDLYTYRAVASDDGVSSAPTGGTYTISVAGLGTTTAIAYDADAATQLSAIKAIAGWSDTLWQAALGASDDALYSWRAKVWPKTPTASDVVGSGLSLFGLGVTTAAIPAPVSFALGGDAWAPVVLSTDGGGIASSTQMRGAALSYVSGWTDANHNYHPPYLTLRSPLYSVTNNRGYGAIRSGRPTAGSVVVTSNAGSQAVALPTEWTAASVGAFGAALSAAIVAARGGSTASISGGRLDDRARHYYDLDATETPWDWQANDGITFSSISWGELKPAAPAGWSYKIGFGTQTATVTAATTSASLKAALEALAFPASLGLSITCDVAQFAHGCSVSIRQFSGRAITFTSSVTPAPSQVASRAYTDGVIDYAVRATVTERNIITTNPHGLTTGAKLMVRQGSAYTFATVPFEVISPTQIRVSNSAAPFNSSATVTAIGKYIARYQPGATTAGMREAYDYWLPGVTPGIATPGDIPTTTAEPTDSEILSAYFAASGDYIDVGSSALSEYLGPIWQRVRKQVKIR